MCERRRQRRAWRGRYRLADSVTAAARGEREIKGLAVGRGRFPLAAVTEVMASVTAMAVAGRGLFPHRFFLCVMPVSCGEGGQPPTGAGVQSRQRVPRDFRVHVECRLVAIQPSAATMASLAASGP